MKRKADKNTLKIVGYIMITLISFSLLSTMYINYKTNKDLKSLEPEDKI